MRPVIRALPREISDKIAAGEVVERPLSVVKELLENSIDAGADTVTVEIKNAGKEYIRVTDNGCGIEKDQLELAFRRYATSKIYTDEDLESISTLGFRGEALASIASVAHVEMLTKTAEDRTGSRILVSPEETGPCQDAACEIGTTIIVTDLFFNIPARKKFLKSDSTEAGLITDYVSKMALAYPQRRFRLINNGNILFSTPGRGDLRNAVATVYDPALASCLLPVSFSDETAVLTLSGLISPPSQSRSSRRNQVFFVNGRWVKCRLFEQAVEDAYKDKLFEGRHPSVFLFLNTDPAMLDVNIHPNKTDIRFLREDETKEFITGSIRRALLKRDAAPGLVQSVTDTNDGKTEPEDKGFLNGTEDRGLMKGIPKERIINLTAADRSPEYGPDPQADEKEEGPSAHEEADDYFNKLRSEKAKEQQLPMFEETGERDFFFSALECLGQVFAAYLIAKDEKGLYFIDQHAAHERVLYEKLMSEFDSGAVSSQLLLLPLLIDIPAALKLEAQERLELLKKIGYSIEDFGPGTIAVKEIPSCMDQREAEDFLNAVLEADPVGRYDLAQKRDLLISKACKSAIKANDHMSDAEISELFRQLDNCENPFSCPHGRPTFIKCSEYEMERMFKRK